MGWIDSHLHEFDVDGARYGRPDPDWSAGEVGDEARVKLFRLVGQGGHMDYADDFGDGMCAFDPPQRGTDAQLAALDGRRPSGSAPRATVLR